MKTILTTFLACLALTLPLSVSAQDSFGDNLVPAQFSDDAVPAQFGGRPTVFVFLGRDAAGVGTRSRSFKFRKAGVPDVYYTYVCHVNFKGRSANENALLAHKFIATPPHRVHTQYFANRTLGRQSMRIRRYANQYIPEQYGCRLSSINPRTGLSKRR